MQGILEKRDSREAGLWLASLVVSLLVNLVVLIVLAFATIHSWMSQPRMAQDDPAAEMRTITIQPVTSSPAAEAKEPPKQAVRTSADQAGPAPENAPFIGEHETQAAGNRPAVVTGPKDLPSQDGIKPMYDEVETTESDYQEGDLSHDRVGAEQAEATSGVPTHEVKDGVEAEAANAAATQPKPRLAEGPLPVDRPVPKEEEDPKPKIKEQEAMKTEQRPKPTEASDSRPPGFRGFQRRTELKGSISRTGRPALDVNEGALGRYHAGISRAIEQAWQRQVVRNRDYITPGVIRIRVVLDENGKVRSVGTVEEFGIGTIQRGFTHAAIREADLPPMPADVKKELRGEPLELLYNFIF